MTDREALAAALERTEDQARRGVFPLGVPEPIWDAARERLAQKPVICGTCGGKGGIDCDDPECLLHPWHECKVCHGRGTVYPAALVEVVFDVIWNVPENKRNYREWMEDVAVLVLDAINGYGQTGETS